MIFLNDIEEDMIDWRDEVCEFDEKEMVDIIENFIEREIYQY